VEFIFGVGVGVTIGVDVCGGLFINVK